MARTKDGSQPSIPIETALDGVHECLDALWPRLVGSGLTEGASHNRILFVSPSHGSGNTTLAICTALGIVRNMREEVCLIEANPFSPAMASYLDLSSAPGITDVLDGRAPIDQAVHNSLVRDLFVFPAGTYRQSVRGELADEEFRRLMEIVCEGRRHCVIDAPPMLEHPEARALLDYADKVVVVLQAGESERYRARALVRLLREAGANLVGTVLNRFQNDLPFGLGGGEWLVQRR